MNDQFLPLDQPINAEPEIIPKRKVAARVAGVYRAQGDHFETQKVDWIDLGFDGIRDDYHQGLTRRSGGREPWYSRGTEMRNERHLSILSPDELGQIADGMGLPAVMPEWIGANLLLDGVARLSYLPAGTMLFFAGGVTLKVDGQNAPCGSAGRNLAKRAGIADMTAGSVLFPKVARRLRGLVAWVEKPGRIEDGEEVSVRVPEQWIWRG